MHNYFRFYRCWMPVNWNTAHSFLLPIRQRISVESEIFVWNDFWRIWNRRCVHAGNIAAIPFATNTHSSRWHTYTWTLQPMHTTHLLLQSILIFIFFLSHPRSTKSRKDYFFLLPIEHGIPTADSRKEEVKTQRAFLFSLWVFTVIHISQFFTTKQTIGRRTSRQPRFHEKNMIYFIYWQWMLLFKRWLRRAEKYVGGAFEMKIHIPLQTSEK